MKEMTERTLGFQPALLEVATMRIYPRDCAETCAPDGGIVLAGFERGGFFYTRRAAARACKEWGLGD